MNFKKIGKLFTSKFVGFGPSSYKKGLYRAAVSQRLRNTGLEGCLSDGSRLPLGFNKPTDQWIIWHFPLGIKQPRLEFAQYV
jgi:hypothetical protein